MVKHANRAKMTTATTGTGTITLGSASDGYQSFADAGVSNGDTVRYVLEDGANNNFEIGTGTYTSSGTTLSRSVTESSNSDSAINLSGNASVFLAVAAQDLSPTVTLSGAVTGAGTLTDLGDVTIATTATSDPTITLSGDASGSATLTNLGNATLSVTVADDSHNHVISNVDGLQSALDGKLSTSGNAATATTAGTVTTAAQPNITSVGTLTGLTTSGNVDATGTFLAGNNDSIFAENNLAFKSSGTAYIDHYTTDADIIFRTSNSSALDTTALTLDASDGGSATFNNNLYVPSKIYHTGDTDTYMEYGANTLSVITGGTNRFVVNNDGVRLGDTGNGYFQPVSGDYGSIQIDGGAHNSYEGYSIGGRAVFMHNNDSVTGIYNDVDNEWMAIFRHNAEVELHYNGIEMFATTSDGAHVKGNLYTDGSLAEDYDALSGTTPTCNVDNGGMFSLTMSGNTTFTFSGASSGYSQGFILQLTGNGGTVTYPNTVDFAGGTAPDAPASGETDILVFVTRDGGSNWYGALAVDAAA